MDTSSILTNINPGASKLKRFVVRVSFFVLGRGLQAASRFDNQVKGEVSGWNEGFTVVMKVKWPNLSLAWQKSGDRITYMPKIDS